MDQEQLSGCTLTSKNIIRTFFSFLTTLELFYCLFWGLETVNTYHCTLLASISTLTSKNISRILFVVWLSPKVFFLPFSFISTWKWIKYSSLASVYTLDTPSTSYFFVYNRWNRNISFSWCSLASKISMVPFFFFKISKYVRWYLVCFLFASKYVISAVFSSLPCNCISGPVWLKFNVQKHHSYFAFSLLTTFDPFYCLFVSF